MYVFLIFNATDPLHPWAPHQQIHPTKDWKYSGKKTIPESSKKQNLSLLCAGNGLHCIRHFKCSCLENLRDGGAWWAAIYGVAQSQTRLKWLSSSSRDYLKYMGGCVWVNANTTSLYIRELSILRFWNSCASWNQSPHPTPCIPRDGAIPKYYVDWVPSV